MPWPATPAATPRASQSRTPIQLKNRPENIAVIIPVRITKTTVIEGWPPICSLIPIAIGVVTDLGAIDRTTVSEAPSHEASKTALADAMAAPAATPARRLAPL